MTFAKISGIGGAVPEKVLDNNDMAKIVDTNDQWIRERTGIATRRISDKETAASDLALLAAQEAMNNAGITAEDLDMILVATTTPDFQLFPSTACVLQRKLGAGKIPAYDISAACTGFIYGLANAYSFIKSGLAKNVLVCGVDLLTKFIDWTDRRTCVLFGDGAGAAIVQASSNPEDESMLAFDLHADGNGEDMLKVHAGGSREPISVEAIEQRRQYMTMDGPAVYRFAVSVIVDSIKASLKKAGLETTDITHFAPHQANIRIIDYAAKKLKLEKEQITTNVERFGNTSAASIPLLLSEMNREGKLKKGDIIASVGFGAGLTYGSTIIKW